MPSRFELANAIRALSMDAVQKANSGHPGMPMGMADIAEVLWNDFLNHNPLNPKWSNRDRFVLSNGHGSMLQYALLHLSGYDLSMEDLKAFRQRHSKTPGHPEYGQTPGVETTTGPLGQGLANAVGMALAEALLAVTFNRENYPIINHFTYCFVGDGCLMEGVSHEAASLAGTLGLGKLIVFWDDNGISIDGKTAGWFLEDVPKRFEAYGWQVISDIDGHNSAQIRGAIVKARENQHQPTLIACKTIIGFGASKVAGTEKCHGSPLGADTVADARKTLDWQYEPFTIPNAIYEAWDAKARGTQKEEAWQALLGRYREAHPELAQELERRWQGNWVENSQSKLDALIREIENKKENIATRQASKMVLDGLYPFIPELIGGSADLSDSNLTHSRYSKAVLPGQFQGNYIHYGVREFGMSAIMNGIALYSGFIPYGGTFLVFLDYGRNAVRLAALMKIRVIFVYSHDSVALGEDGPTHQPIEHLTMLRATPNLSLWRPCDATETAVAWKMALQRTAGPTSLILTRQAVPHQPKTDAQINDIARGGYILVECEGPIDAILIATGSEVALAVLAAERLKTDGYHIRVVSMPSTDVFKAQLPDYQASVLPTAVKKRIAVEAGATHYWHQWVGLEGCVVGIDHYGISAPGKMALEACNMTVDHIVLKTTQILASPGG